MKPVRPLTFLHGMCNAAARNDSLSSAVRRRFATPAAAFLGLTGLFSFPAHAHPGSVASVQLPLGLALAGAAALFLYRAHRYLNRLDELNGQLREAAAANVALREENALLREAEAQARINADRFRSLTRLSVDWYWEQDEQFRFTMRTTWLLHEAPIANKEYIGLCRWELPGVVGDPGWEEHRRILEAHQPYRGFEYQFRHGDVVRWLTINGEPMFDRAGKFCGYRGTGRDITRRKNAEYALRASEERFQKIVDSMPVGLFIKDPEGRIVLMNRESERQWGVDFGQIEGTDGGHVVPPEQLARYLASDREAFLARKLGEAESVACNIRTGEQLIVRALKQPVFREDGSPHYLICITVDITAQKRIEEELRRSRESLRQLARHLVRAKEEERKRIARDIHDELGQNLMALRLDVTTQIRETALASPAMHQHALLMMETLDRTIRSIRHIINDLRPGVLDLGLIAALEWQADEFIRRSGLECVVEIDDESHEPQLDDAQATTLFRVLQESLTNVQRHAQATSVRVRLYREADRVFLGVADNGRGGVDLQGLRNQQFGLLGMKERLRMLDGTLEVGSAPHGGTVLVASLPLVPAGSDEQA